MTLLEIVTRMRDETAQHARRTRYRGQEEYLQDKQAHCRRIEELTDELMRRAGTPERLTLRPGTVVVGRRIITVETRARRRA